MRRTCARASVAGMLAVGLAGCSTTSVSPSAAPTAPLSSVSPAPVLDLQLRPVLDVSTAEAGQCPSTAVASPDPDAAATACSQDRLLVYSLAPAAVTGARVTGLEASPAQGRATVQIRLDPRGGAALSRVTADGALRSSPQSQLAILSHGRVQSAPTVTEQIDGSVMVITGFETLEDAQQAVDFLAS